MKRSFLLSIFSLYITCLYSQIPTYVPTNGLVGYWSFSGNANDESGNGNNGTVLSGTTLASDRFNNSNSSYLIDGVNCPDSKGILLPTAINNSGDYTISIWFQTNDSTKQLQTLFNSYPHQYIASSFNYFIANNTSGSIGNGTWVDVGGSNWSTFNLTSWHHIVVVKVSLDYKFYQDGNLVYTRSISPIYNNGSFTNINIGAISINGGSACYETFSGKLDDVGVWSRALTQQEITNLHNSQNCSAVITLNGPSSICFGQNQNIGLSVDSSGTVYKQYIWSTGDTTPSITVRPTQTIKYKVTVSQNGSICRDSITITVNAKPTVAPTATPAIICQGQISTLATNATAGSGTISSYAWSSGLVGNVSGGSVSPGSTTTYTVTVTNSNSCSSSASATVTVNAKPTVSPTSTPATICQGQSSTLAANATAGSGTISSYAWSSGLIGNVSGGSVSPVATTTYTVTVRNSNSCSASASVIVNVNPLPVVSINSFPAFVNINAVPVILSGSPVGGNFSGPGVSVTSFYPSSAGLGRKQIIYSYTNGNGCSNSANSSTIVYDTIVCHISVTDTLIINTVLTGISPPNNINPIKIYPNPASDHLNINTGNYSMMNGYTIKIINPLSQVVFQNLINQQLFNVSLTGWSHGSYIIQILDTTNTVIETKVLVLQ